MINNKYLFKNFQLSYSNKKRTISTDPFFANCFGLLFVQKAGFIGNYDVKHATTRIKYFLLKRNLLNKKITFIVLVYISIQHRNN